MAELIIGVGKPKSLSGKLGAEESESPVDPEAGDEMPDELEDLTEDIMAAQRSGEASSYASALEAAVLSILTKHGVM